MSSFFNIFYPVLFLGVGSGSGYFLTVGSGSGAFLEGWFRICVFKGPDLDPDFTRWSDHVSLNPEWKLCIPSTVHPISLVHFYIAT